MAQSLVQAMPHLARDHGSRNQLAVWMLQAGPGIHTVILENRDVVDTVVGTQQIVAFFEDAQYPGDLHVRQQSHAGGVVRSVNDYFVEAEALNPPPGMLQAAGGLDVTGKRRKFVGDHSYRPEIATIRRKSRDLRRGLALVAWAERATLQKCRHDLCRAAGG